MALPLTLIFVAVFSVLGMGILAMGTDEMTLVGNFEHGVRAFYYAEAVFNEAAAGYKHTGKVGYYEYSPGGNRVAAVAEITYEQGIPTIRATGRSGDVTKHLEGKVQMQNGVLVVSQWKDYGLDDVTPRL
jgi:hypothetical protein